MYIHSARESCIMTSQRHCEVILLKHDHQFIELQPRPAQMVSANWCRDRTCGCCDNRMASPSTNLPSLFAFKYWRKGRMYIKGQVLKAVKNNDSVCWCWRAATVQLCAYSPLFEGAVWVVVSFYNVPNGYGWKWWHTWWRRSFHKAIMAVTYHLGRG